MKKLSLFGIVFLFVLTLSACTDVCVGTACITGETEDPIEVDCELNPEDPACETDDPVDPVDPVVPQFDSILYYDHINGHGTITEDHLAYLLFEEEMLGYVKYQVSYLSCTCRNSDVNYWQVMYIEISTTDNSIQRISFDSDKETGAHTYTAGMWGDSSPTPGPSGDYSDGKYYEDFVSDFFPWLLGQTPETLEGISVFTNDDYHGVQNTKTIAETDLIDSFAGSSVSTNNMIRIIQTMFDYHIENYG